MEDDSKGSFRHLINLTDSSRSEEGSVSSLPSSTSSMEDSAPSQKLLLRIEIEDYEALKSSRSVTIKFDPDTKVKQALLQLASKGNIGLTSKQALAEYMLFVPNFDEKRGIFMANERALSSYGLKDKDTILLKKRSMSFRDILPLVNKANAAEGSTKTEPSPTIKPRRATRAISILAGTESLKKGSFNVPLGNIEHKTFFGLPVILDKTVEFLETRAVKYKGIFQTKANPKEVQDLREAFERGDEIIFSKNTSELAVGELLLLWLTSLPEPLMTYPLYDTIISEVKLDSRNWIWDAKFFIYNLPQVNKAVLSRLMEFLKNLMKHSSETGLTYEYIAKAFGPSLLRPHPKLVISASEEKTSNQAIFDRIIKEFIENQELLFVYPGPKKPKTLPGEEVVSSSADVLTHSSLLDAEHLENQLTLVGTVWVTNYRLVWIQTYVETTENAVTLDIDIPLTTILSVRKIGKMKSKRVTGGFVLQTRDFRTQAFAFTQSEFKAINDHVTKSIAPKAITSLYAFYYNPVFSSDIFNGWLAYDPNKEYERHGVSWGKWRMSKVNKEFSICEHYPRELCVPAAITDELLTKASKTRLDNRWPQYTWGSKKNGAAIYRAGPPLGYSNWSSSQKSEDADSKIYGVFLSLNRNSGEKLNVFDTGMPQPWHNTAYPKAEVTHLSIASMKIMQETYEKLEKMTSLTTTGTKMDVLCLPWIGQIKSLLYAATTIVEYTASGESVLIQEGVDNDSVAPIVSLAQILLDPYFRTLEGFFVLIEKDWLSFGFPFAKRNGHSSDKKKASLDDIAPTFLQFLDAVWQLWQKFPSYFEFNEEFITFVARHQYSSRFGTFIANSEKDRKSVIKTKTISIWTQIVAEKKRFVNPYYVQNASVIKFDLDLLLWKKFYLYWNQQMSIFSQKIRPVQVKPRSRSSSLQRVVLDIPAGPNSPPGRVDACITLRGKELALLPEEVKQLAAQAQGIDLYDNDFNNIPTEVLALDNIQTINMGKNKLDHLSEDFMSVMGNALRNLETLNLSGNQLKTLPSSLTKLVQLRSLDLSENHLHKVSSSIGKLTNLLHLELAKNRLSHFPKVSKLPELTYLDVSGCPIMKIEATDLIIPKLRVLKMAKLSITKIPEFDIPFLEELDLSRNKIKKIPGTLFTKIQNTIKILKLKHCGLTELPSELELLTQLVELDIQNNEIMDFNPEIIRLTKLQKLNMKSNRIAIVPGDISALKNLQEFNIQDNLVEYIPPSIGTIESLRSLDISSNKLDSLPPTITLLPLVYFNFDNNKLRLIPKSIITGGMQSIIGHLKDLLKGSEPCYRMRLVIVGQENVGKTTLSHCLRKKAKSSIGTISTDGINIDPWPAFYVTSPEDKNKKHEVELTVWDFAGQEIYYATHQFFISTRSLFILVWSVLDDPANSKVDFWLYSIKARAKNVPVFVVGTHLDKLPKDAASYMLGKLEKQFKTQFPGVDIYFRAVSCTTGEGIAKLRQDIEEVVIRQKHMGEQIPISSLLLEKQILELGEKKMPPIINRHQLSQIASSCNITDDKSLSRASRTLHEFGSLVHFESDPKLQDLVILSPRWLTETMATVLTTKHTFAKNGVLPHQSLLQIWRPPKYPPEIHETLLSILENFEIAFPLTPFTKEYDGTSLIPSLLSTEKPPEVEKLWPKTPRKDQKQIGRRYSFDFIPYGLFGRLIVRLLYFVTPKTYWKNGILLARQGKDELIYIEVFPDAKIIDIAARGPEGSVSIPRVIIESVETLIRHWYRVSLQVFVPCVHCIEEGYENIYMFPLEECESSAVKGKQFLNCMRQEDHAIPVRLDQLVPDLTLVDYGGSRIPFEELKLERVIGEGGAATVHYGLWKESPVAIKMLRITNSGDQLFFDDEENSFSKTFNEFRREVLVMSSLEHPNLVQLQGLCFDPLCIVTEFMESGDLYNFIHKKDVEFDWSLKMKIAIDIANGMAFLHSAKPPIVHRDLKSPNVLLASTSTEAPVVAKISDFGLSGAVRTVASTEVANPKWLAPEVMGGSEFTEASDVYSFGVILWELVTRDSFFSDTNFNAEIENRVKAGKRPAIPKECHATYAVLIQECWSQSPKDRPHFREIVTRLQDFYQNELSKLPDIKPIVFRNVSRDNLLRAMEGKSPVASPTRHLEEKKEPSPIKESKKSDSEGESSSEDEAEKKAARNKNLPPAGPTGYDFLMNLGFALKKSDPSLNTRKLEESSDEE